MRWSKIKNIIILLLVVVNGFLLAQVGLREWKSRRGERETRERMVTILSRNGVSYLPEEVPGELEPAGSRITLRALNEAEAAVLVGEVSDTQTLGARMVYTGAEGTVVGTSAGELTAEFPADGAVSEPVLLERLAKLGVTLQRDGSADVGENERAYVQIYNGFPVPGETALLSLDRDHIRLTLRCLTGEEEPLTTETTITAATALTRFLDELNRGDGYVCSQITAMYPGYVPDGAGTVTLTPAWFIETDTWRFIVDGYTGAVTAAE